MKIVVKTGDLLDEKADVLLATANAWLAMSGGVNGAILARGNKAIAAELKKWLADRGLKSARQGTVVPTSAGNLQAHLLLHCVAVDGFYQSSPGVIESTVKEALRMAAESGGRTVAMPMLATGFGPLKPEEFAAGLKAALGAGDPRIETLTVVVRKPDEQAVLVRVLGLQTSRSRLHSESPKRGAVDQKP